MPLDSRSGARRLLVLVSSMARGGTESRLADVLRTLDRRRYEPVLGVLHSGALLAELQGVRVHARLARYSGDPLVLARVHRLFRSERPEVVWCAGHGLTAMLGLLAARLFSVPTIVSVHGIERADATVFSFLERRLVAGAARVLIVTETYRERLMREGVRSERIVTQLNGIDLARFGPPAPDRRARLRGLGVSWSGPVIGHVGNLTPLKAQHVLLTALARVREHRPDTGLVLVGDGPLRGELEVLTERLGLRDAVLMLGTRSDVPDLMRLFDVFVLSSQLEGCPNVAIEAMAAGLPVVATDAGGSREVVADGETGSIVPVADAEALARAVARLLDDPTAARAMGERGLRRAQELFSLDRMVEDRMALFDDVLAEHSHQR